MVYKTNVSIKLKKDIKDIKDIIIVGSGPIGLYCAVHLLLQNYNVIIYEKYSKKKTFQRSNNVQLLKSSFDKKIIKELNLEFNNQNRIFISINVLQEKLTILFKKLNGRIKYNSEITFNKDKLYNNNKELNADLYIVAQGSKSDIRDKLIKHDLKVVYPQYLLDIRAKITSTNKTKLILSQIDKYVLTKQTGSFIRSTIYTYKNKEKELRTTIFLSTKEYEKLTEKGRPTFKNFWYLEKIEKTEVFDKVISWLRGLECILDVKVKEKPRISIYQIGAYNMEKTDYNLPILIIGDARSGLPYFRSLNKGLLEVNMLIKLLLNKNDMTLSKLLLKYDKLANNIYKKELQYVKIKHLYIEYIKKYTNFLNKSFLFYKNDFKDCEDFTKSKTRTLQILTLGLYGVINYLLNINKKKSKKLQKYKQSTKKTKTNKQNTK